MRILGIDQGIANLGYSILEEDKLITYGCINTNSKDIIEDRFFIIYDRLKSIIENYHPSIICCEKLFYTSPQKGNRNKSASIIYTNMITGVLSVLAGQFNIELRMFVPSKVKKALCDNGKAQKDEIITKIKSLYEVETDKTKYEHVCDSIAIAYTCYIENKENPSIRKEFEDYKKTKEEKRLKEELRLIKRREKEAKKTEREKRKLEREKNKKDLTENTKKKDKKSNICKR